MFILSDSHLYPYSQRQLIQFSHAWLKPSPDWKLLSNDDDDHVELGLPAHELKEEVVGGVCSRAGAQAELHHPLPCLRHNCIQQHQAPDLRLQLLTCNQQVGCHKTHTL